MPDLTRSPQLSPESLIPQVRSTCIHGCPKKLHLLYVDSYFKINYREYICSSLLLFKLFFILFILSYRTEIRRVLFTLYLFIENFGLLNENHSRVFQTITYLCLEYFRLGSYGIF